MLSAKLLYSMDLELNEPLLVPNGPKGGRAIVAVKGKVYGPALNGEIVAPSSDWLTLGADGILIGIDLNVVIRTTEDDDDEQQQQPQLIYKHVIGRSMRDVNNPANSTIRSGVTFEAPPGKYQYLNNKFVFGHGVKTGNKITMHYYDTS